MIDDRSQFARVAMARSQRGAMLVESLVAIALLALGAASVGGFMSSQIRHASASHLSSQAYSLAADELERVRARPWTEVTSSTRNEKVGDIEFAVDTAVLADVPAKNVKSISVAVEWNEPGGARHVEVHTVYTQIFPE